MILYTSDQVYAVLQHYMPIICISCVTYLICETISYVLLFKALSEKRYKALIPFYREMCLAKITRNSRGFVLWAITPMTYPIYFIAYLQIRYDLVTRKKYSWFMNFVFTLLPVIGNVVYYFLWRSEHVNLHKESGLGEAEKKCTPTRKSS